MDSHVGGTKKMRKAKNVNKVIELTDLLPRQKVKMKRVYDGKIGIIEKQIVPKAYEIRIGNISVVAGTEFFEIIPERKDIS